MQIYIAWDIPQFNPDNAAFLKEVAKRGVGPKVGLIAATAVDLAGNVIAHTILDCTDKLGVPGIYDGKFGDIPHQVAGAVANITKRGVLGMTVRANAEKRMLQDAVAARDKAYAEYAASTERSKARPKPILFGVAVLSSEAEDRGGTLNYTGRARDAGFEGIVVPGGMLEPVKQDFPELATLVIGIRPPWATWIRNDDQHQTITHLEARDRGADHIAIGRAISHAPNPLEALDRILHELRHH